MSRGEPPPRGLSRRERLSWRVMLAAAGASRLLVERLRDALAWPLRLVARASTRASAARCSRRRARTAFVVAPRGARGSRPASSSRASTARRRSGASGAGADARRARGPARDRLAARAPRVRDGRRARARDSPSSRGRCARRLPPRPQPPGASSSASSCPGAPALAREMTWHAMHLRSAQVRDTCSARATCRRARPTPSCTACRARRATTPLRGRARVLRSRGGARDAAACACASSLPTERIATPTPEPGRPTSAGVHRAPTRPAALPALGRVRARLRHGDRRLRQQRRAPPCCAPGAGCATPSGSAHTICCGWAAATGTTRSPRSRRAGARSTAAASPASTRRWRRTCCRARRRSCRRRRTACARSRTALRAALADTWTGSWFLRGFDGRGGAIGHDRLFLDANAWCLIARIGSEAQRRTLVRAIAAALRRPLADRPDDPRSPAHVRGGLLPPGWDTNGGVWAAISALTAWGSRTARSRSRVALSARTDLRGARARLPPRLVRDLERTRLPGTRTTATARARPSYSRRRRCASSP